MNLFLAILTLFKAVGIIILVLLAVIACTLLIVLLCGIKYAVRGDYNNGKGYADGSISWLFGVIRASFVYKDNKFGYNLKVPLLSFISKRDSAKGDSGGGEAAATEEKQQTKSKTEHKTKSVKRPPQKKDGLLDKLKRAFYYYRQYEVDKLIKPLCAFVKELMRALGMKGRADVAFGFDDPSLTGVTLGGGAVIAPFLPIELDLKPDFNGKYFAAEGGITGKTSVFRLLVPVVRLVLTKPVLDILLKRKG